MPEWFDIAKDDQWTVSLKVPPNVENYVAEQLRRSGVAGSGGPTAATRSLHPYSGGQKQRSRPMHNRHDGSSP
jgi:hypothetical protein